MSRTKKSSKCNPPIHSPVFVWKELNCCSEHRDSNLKALRQAVENVKQNDDATWAYDIAHMETIDVLIVGGSDHATALKQALADDVMFHSCLRLFEAQNILVGSAD